jgi:cell division protein FtsB
MESRCDSVSVMAFRQFIQRRARYVALPVIGALVLAYFGYYAVQGDRGLLAYLRLAQEIRKAEITRDLLRSERETIERRVKLLRPDSIDPDMLDERVRATLGLSRPDEVVVLLRREDEPRPVLLRQ